jgi:ABC-type transport system involved in multi-copper enzyme maturation permease subunit
MKYLAILKDSLREAIDNKVIFVMIGISLLVTLFVFSLGFTPLPPEQMMGRLLKGQVIDLRQFQQGGAVEVREDGPPPPQIEQGKGAPKKPVEFGRFVVRKAEVIRGAPGSPDSAYRYTIALPVRTAQEAERIKAQPAAEVARLRSRLLAPERLQYFTVTDVRFRGAAAKTGEAPEMLFEVTTEPTESTRLVWGNEYSMLWGAVPLGGGAPLGMVLLISTVSVLGIGSWVTLMVSVIITAFFIPNMLRKGTVDLLLVRPISRWALLAYKFVGGLTFIFINTAVAIVGMWLALGVRSGVWANSFLLMIFVYTFFFAILYAVSALFAVLTRSAIVAILVTCAAWFVFFVVGLLYALNEGNRMQEARRGVPPERRTADNAFFQVMRVVHFVLPRTSDLNQLGNEALVYDFLPRQALLREAMRTQQEASPFNWTESISVSLAFIAVMLGLACWWFATRDY